MTSIILMAGEAILNTSLKTNAMIMTEIMVTAIVKDMIARTQPMGRIKTKNNLNSLNAIVISVN